MASPGYIDRSLLNTEVANLAAGQTADPEALEDYLIQVADQLDANWGDYNAFKLGNSGGVVDGGGFTDPSSPSDTVIDGGTFV